MCLPEVSSSGGGGAKGHTRKGQGQLEKQCPRRGRDEAMSCSNLSASQEALDTSPRHSMTQGSCAWPK